MSGRRRALIVTAACVGTLFAERSAVAWDQPQTAGAILSRDGSGVAQVHTSDAEREVRAAEQRRFDVLVRGDYEALASLLDDDLTYSHSTGAVDSKASYLAPLLAGRTRYESATTSDLVVRIYGSTAVLTGRLDSVAVVGGERRVNALRYTDVWVRRDSGWRLVAWHSARVP